MSKANHIPHVDEANYPHEVLVAAAAGNAVMNIRAALKALESESLRRRASAVLQASLLMGAWALLDRNGPPVTAIHAKFADEVLKHTLIKLKKLPDCEDRRHAEMMVESARHFVEMIVEDDVREMTSLKITHEIMALPD